MPNLAAQPCIDDLSVNTVNRALTDDRGPDATGKRIVTLIAIYLAPPFVFTTEIEVAAIIVAATIQGRICIDAHCSSMAFEHDVSARLYSQDMSTDSVSRDITKGRSHGSI